jgi:hypothetical protein
MIRGIRDKIFNIRKQEDFWEMALEVYYHQSHKNNVFREFTDGLGRSGISPDTPDKFTFLPVEFFRNKKIICRDLPVEMIFESSSTTGVNPAKHFVSDLSIYRESFRNTFRLFYGEPEQYVIAALLPSYIERKGSSLVYMTDNLIKWSNKPLSGFYKSGTEELLKVLNEAKTANHKAILLGVSFALLDLAENQSPDLSGIIVMETGGMKGRRKEITRAELHKILTTKFKVPLIHSEYGMTELLSQAYSKGNGIFYCPPWMKVLIRDPHDPLAIYNEPGITGGINIIDLANINSCSFIATGDLGKLHEDGGFEVLGRFDNSDIRGCNLLVD